MKIGSLTLLHRTSCPRTHTLASYHPRSSATWLWSVSLRRRTTDEARSWGVWRPRQFPSDMPSPRLLVGLGPLAVYVNAQTALPAPPR